MRMKMLVIISHMIIGLILGDGRWREWLKKIRFGFIKC